MEVTEADRWTEVAIRMNLPRMSSNNKDYGAVLRSHYEKHLYPYELFESGGVYAGSQRGAVSKHEAAIKKSPKKVGYLYMIYLED